MRGASIHLEGVRELRQQLQLLPARTMVRVMKPALLAAGRVLAAEVRRRAPRGKPGESKRPGQLKRSVRTEAPRGFNPLEAEINVGFRRGGGRHAHLNERGTKRRANRAGANRGVMPAVPFFAPAIAAKTAAAFDALRVVWSARLAIEANRIKRGLVRSDGRLR